MTSKSNRPSYFLASAGLAICSSTLLGMLALWPTVWSLALVWWHDKNFQFGIAVGLVSLGWLFAIGRKMSQAPMKPQPFALIALVLALCIWSIAYSAASSLAQQLLLPVIIGLAVLTTAGALAARACAEPLAALFLAIPLWDYLIPGLQMITVFVTESALGLLGIPATVEAYTITIPAGSFEIAEGCAGIRYLVVAITLGAFAGAYFRLGVGQRILVLVVAAAIALVTNWFRVLVIVVAGHLTDMQHYLVAEEHVTFGTFLFGIVILGLVLLLHYLPSGKNPSIVGDSKIEFANEKPPLHMQFASVICLAILVAVPAFARHRVSSSDGIAVLGSLPLLTGRWHGPYPPDNRWAPKYLGFTDEVRAAYRSESDVIEVYANSYGPQRAGFELVSMANSLTPAGSWSDVKDERVLAVSTASFEDPQIMTYEAASSGRQWVIAYVYRSGGRAFYRPDLYQITYGAQALLGRPASGIFAAAMRCNNDCKAAHGKLADFWSSFGDSFVQVIPNTYVAGGQWSAYEKR